MQLYTCFEYRRFIAQNYGDFGRHLAFVICASMPGRILRCFARPASTLKVPRECLGRRQCGPGLLTRSLHGAPPPPRPELQQVVLSLSRASVAHSPLLTCRVGLQRYALLAVHPAMAPRVSTCVDSHAPSVQLCRACRTCARAGLLRTARTYGAGSPWVAQHPSSA